MVIRLYENNPRLSDVERIADILRNGGVVIYPTDTVYAIGCDALNVRAAERICKLKGINPLKSNLSIIGHDISSLSKYAKISDGNFKLIKNNTPGPFTFILPTASGLPKLYKNRKSVGVRIPDNNITRVVAEVLGNPLLSSSLNDDEEIGYVTDPELIAEKYSGIADVIIDGGMGGEVASTVVDCTGDEITVIRQGAGNLIF